jgi:hypothetical protein
MHSFRPRCPQATVDVEPDSEDEEPSPPKQSGRGKRGSMTSSLGHLPEKEQEIMVPWDRVLCIDLMGQYKIGDKEKDNHTVLHTV